MRAAEAGAGGEVALRQRAGARSGRPPSLFFLFLSLSNMVHKVEDTLRRIVRQGCHDHIVGNTEVSENGRSAARRDCVQVG